MASWAQSKNPTQYNPYDHRGLEQHAIWSPHHTTPHLPGDDCDDTACDVDVVRLLAYITLFPTTTSASSLPAEATRCRPDDDAAAAAAAAAALVFPPIVAVATAAPGVTEAAAGVEEAAGVISAVPGVSVGVGVLMAAAGEMFRPPRNMSSKPSAMNNRSASASSIECR